MLTEYLFRDSRRLNEYAAQINPALTVVEKSKEWTVGLSLAGPKAEGKQSERVRPMTDHEKAQLTLGYLRANSQVHEGRPVPSTQSQADWERPSEPFVFERCIATRISVPSTLTEGGDNFALWVSYTLVDEQPCDVLWLVEDATTFGEPAPSGFTLFQMFSEYVREQLKLRESSLTGKLDPVENPYSGYVTIEWRPFMADPIRTAKELGCRVSTARAIETLYLIRDVGGASRRAFVEGPQPGYALFGYPLWISAA